MFNGKLILSSEVPWYYIFGMDNHKYSKYDFILFFVGIILFLVDLSNNIILKKNLKSLQNESIIFLFLIIPIFAFIVFKPDIFNR